LSKDRKQEADYKNLATGLKSLSELYFDMEKRLKRIENLIGFGLTFQEVMKLFDFNKKIRRKSNPDKIFRINKDGTTNLVLSRDDLQANDWEVVKIEEEK
jgi:hypothetical protein